MTVTGVIINSFSRKEKKLNIIYVVKNTKKKMKLVSFEDWFLGHLK